MSALVEFSRRGAKALAEDLLPDSVVFWRGAEGRRKPLSALRRALLGPSPAPGRVALTFDDGPLPLTRDYLRVLSSLDVRATFFLVGELCARDPGLVREIADAGHELAGHGYTHRRFTTLSQAELAAELVRTSEVLPKTPSARKLVRPPYGAVSPATLLTCAREGFTTVLWSFDSGDWANHNASDIERAVVEHRTAPGEIVLLHEGQPWTLDALPAIVGNLRKAGHELVSVGELLA